MSGDRARFPGETPLIRGANGPIYFAFTSSTKCHAVHPMVPRLNHPRDIPILSTIKWSVLQADLW